MDDEKLRGAVKECLSCRFADIIEKQNPHGYELCPEAIDEVADNIIALYPKSPGDKEPLFKLGDFTLHSGEKSDFKIDCDALCEADWACLAHIISTKHKFSNVIGIPEGGLKLARALCQYSLNGEPTLIVDDVLTTGSSLEEARKQVRGESIGAVAFARGKCPAWVTPLFQLRQSKPPDDKRTEEVEGYSQSLADVAEEQVKTDLKKYRKGSPVSTDNPQVQWGLE